MPYRGGGLALTDVMAGQVKFFFANGSAVVGLIKGGKVKAIAHTGKGRLASLPDIPPVSDTLPGFEGYEWNGVFVPHGTPAAIVQKLNAGDQQGAGFAAGDGAICRAQCRDASGTRRRNSALMSTIRWRCGAVSSKKPISSSADGQPQPPRIAGPVAQPKRPRVVPPPGAWDTHCACFGPSDKFPYAPGRGYTPPDAPVERFIALLDHLGFANGSWCRATRTSMTIASCSTR